MKILVGGTFSSGKTTLSNSLQTSFPDSILIPELSGELKRMFPQITWREKPIRNYMLIEQIMREQKSFKRKKFVFCDSGVIEIIAHNIIFGYEPGLEILDYLNHQRYDMILFCKSDIPLKDNGIREKSPTLRKQINEILLEIINQLGYTPQIVSGPLKNRLIQAKIHIQDYFVITGE